MKPAHQAAGFAGKSNSRYVLRGLTMYEVHQAEPSQAFKSAWNAAGRHIQRQAGDRLNWLRADLNPPMAEHLSFRMGNQIFFIYVEAAEFQFKREGSLFLRVAHAANAVPCILTMNEQFSMWQPQYAGWGLVHAETDEPIVPPTLISDQLVEMTDWELHDFCVQVVCNYLKQQNKEVFAKQSSPEIDPSIWFRDQNGTHFVVARATRYPESEAGMPSNVSDIKRSCAAMSQSGFYASVSVANADELSSPLYRGHGMHVRFTGLVDL